MSLEVRPLTGIPEITYGDDLPALLADAAGDDLRDGDILVVTQKVVSKAEGRTAPEADREAAIERETRRIVARRAGLVIVETHHGFVCANAGVDRSNVPDGFVTLLPEDPDASAQRLRTRVETLTGRDVAVVITDTFGRPWRRGVVDVAIGCSGLPALVDLRGTKDAAGQVLESTVVALADQVAAAAGMAMPKDAGIPAAVVRGVTTDAPAGSARDLGRPATEDLFRESALLAISARRSVRAFGPGEIPRDVLLEAVAASLTAPVPHGSRHRDRPWRWTLLDSGPARRRLLDAMAAAWRRDLSADGVEHRTIARRIERSERLLGAAAVLAIPAVSLGHMDRYPDERRREAERDMFLLATGAAVQSFMLALHAQGYASCWVSSTLFCKQETQRALGLDAAWLPMGAVAAGLTPSEGSGPGPRPAIDPGSALHHP